MPKILKTQTNQSVAFIENSLFNQAHDISCLDIKICAQCGSQHICERSQGAGNKLAKSQMLSC